MRAQHRYVRWLGILLLLSGGRPCGAQAPASGWRRVEQPKGPVREQGGPGETVSAARYYHGDYRGFPGPSTLFPAESVPDGVEEGRLEIRLEPNGSVAIIVMSPTFGFFPLLGSMTQAGKLTASSQAFPGGLEIQGSRQSSGTSSALAGTLAAPGLGAHGFWQAEPGWLQLPGVRGLETAMQRLFKLVLAAAGSQDTLGEPGPAAPPAAPSMSGGTGFAGEYHGISMERVVAGPFKSWRGRIADLHTGRITPGAGNAAQQSHALSQLLAGAYKELPDGRVVAPSGEVISVDLQRLQTVFAFRVDAAGTVEGVVRHIGVSSLSGRVTGKGELSARTRGGPMAFEIKGRLRAGPGETSTGVWKPVSHGGDTSDWLAVRGPLDLSQPGTFTERFFGSLEPGR